MSGARPERETPLPRQFSEECSAAELERVRRWWSSLPARDQRGLMAMCDPRADACSSHRAQRSDGAAARYGVSLRVCGRFVDATPDGLQGTGADRDGRRDEDCGGGQDDFPIDFYEYLVNHEISLSDTRSYHICTRHQAAVDVVHAGLIPATFLCPLGRSDCPMRQVLSMDPGRSLRLEVEVTPAP